MSIVRSTLARATGPRCPPSENANSNPPRGPQPAEVDSSLLLLRLFLRARGTGLVLRLRPMAPVEAAAENAFDDQVIGRGSWPHTDAEVNLPLRRDVQIGDREDLLLLIVQA